MPKLVKDVKYHHNHDCGAILEAFGVIKCRYPKHGLGLDHVFSGIRIHHQLIKIDQ
jgi:hypothetical protein